MLLTRTLTALVLFVTFVWLVFWAPTGFWLAAILLVTFLAGWEWSGFARFQRLFSKALYSLVLVALVAFVAQSSHWPTLLVLAFLSTLVMTIVVWRYQASEGQAQLQSPFLVLLSGALVIVPFSVSLIAFQALVDPAYLVLSFFVIWAMDTGAYFAGKRFGKHKLAVHASPGKTWEGLYGGAILAFLIAWLGVNIVQPGEAFSYGWLALGLMLIGLYSVVGDLFESVLKRQVKLKDSGHVLPGHGGVLDRLDSAMLAMPWFYIFWVEVLA